MKAAWLVVLLGLGGSAWAQDGGGEAPADRAVPAEAPAPLETAWIASDTSSTRFLGEHAPGPDFRAGTEVKVLVRDGDRARVMAGTRFGWVEAGKLSPTPPQGASSPAVVPPAP